jgi:hypothetical protein
MWNHDYSRISLTFPTPECYESNGTIAQHSTDFGTTKNTFFFCRTCLRYFTVFFFYLFLPFYRACLGIFNITSLLICVPKSWHENIILIFFWEEHKIILHVQNLHCSVFKTALSASFLHEQQCDLPVSYTTLSLMLRRVITNSCKYNHKNTTLYNTLYYCQCSTCFRRIVRPSSGAQNCTHSIWYMLSLLACCYR